MDIQWLHRAHLHIFKCLQTSILLALTRKKISKECSNAGKSERKKKKKMAISVSLEDERPA